MAQLIIGKAIRVDVAEFAEELLKFGTASALIPFVTCRGGSTGHRLHVAAIKCFGES